MTTPRYDRLAAELLASATDTRATPPTAEQRSDAIAAMQAAIQTRARRRARLRTGAIAFAVAAGLAALAVLTWPPELTRPVTLVAQPIGSGATVSNLEGRRPLTAETVIERGERIVAVEDGGATLALSTGTRLALEPNGDVTVVEHTGAQRFALAGGALRADVAKLEGDQRFVVMTLDAEVEVRGTSFRVAVVAPEERCGARTRTRVDVFEGTVRVRGGGRERLLHAGESWPGPCEGPRETERETSLDPTTGGTAKWPEGSASPEAREERETGRPEGSPEARAPAEREARALAPRGTGRPFGPLDARAPAERETGSRGPGSGEAPVQQETGRPVGPLQARAPAEGEASLDPSPPDPAPAAGGTPASSSLGVQNDLFARAAAARRRGDSARAIALYEALLERFPESPLAETAHVEHMRLLRQGDPAAARRAAERYLERYSGGFAREEAERLAADPR